MSIHDYLVDKGYVLNEGVWYIGNTMYIPNDDIAGAFSNAIMEERDIAVNTRYTNFKIVEESREANEWKQAMTSAMLNMITGYREDTGSLFPGTGYIVETKFGDYGMRFNGSYEDDILNNGVIGRFVASVDHSEGN